MWSSAADEGCACTDLVIDWSPNLASWSKRQHPAWSLPFTFLPRCSETCSPWVQRPLSCRINHHAKDSMLIFSAVTKSKESCWRISRLLGMLRWVADILPSGSRACLDGWNADQVSKDYSGTDQYTVGVWGCGSVTRSVTRWLLDKKSNSTIGRATNDTTKIRNHPKLYSPFDSIFRNLILIYGIQYLLSHITALAVLLHDHFWIDICVHSFLPTSRWWRFSAESSLVA